MINRHVAHALGKDSDASIKFGAQRIRLGLKYKNGAVHSKLFVDFMKNADNAENDINSNGIIKDAVMGYKFNNAAGFICVRENAWSISFLR